MDTIETPDTVAQLTLELLRVGWMLEGIAADLTEAIAEDSRPGEDPAAVVMEMISGSIRTAMAGVETDVLQRTTAMIGMAADRVLEHLRQALELSPTAHPSTCARTRTGSARARPNHR